MRNRNAIKQLLCLFFLGCFDGSFAATYPISNGQDVVGNTFVVSLRSGDTMDTLATRYDMSLHEIAEANPRLVFKPRVGQKVIIPARFVLPKKEYRKHGGIVINISELRLYYFSPDGHYVTTYPVALGRKGWRTPTTSARIVKKSVNPDWHVSRTIKRYHYQKTGQWLPDVVRGGTGSNPLGGYAMYLSTPGILMHGTNSPMSIGRFVSSGCIRLAPKNAEALYHQIRVGAPVHIVNHAHKAGWVNGELYLESHVPLEMRSKGALGYSSEEQAVRNAIGGRAADVQWEKVHRVGTRQSGIPQVVGRLMSDAR